MKNKNKVFGLNMTKKTFSRQEHDMYKNLVSTLREAEKHYAEYGKGDKQSFIAVFLMNRGILPPLFTPGDDCYIYTNGKITNGKVLQADTTITTSKVGSVVFYIDEDNNERFFHGTEVGKRVFRTRSAVAEKKRREANRKND